MKGLTESHPGLQSFAAQIWKQYSGNSDWRPILPLALGATWVWVFPDKTSKEALSEVFLEGGPKGT